MNEKRDGAEAVVNRRIPVLAAAGMMGQAIIARDPSEKKKLDLRLKMARLKESVVREATMREAAMHDREEVWALEAIISCLAENRVGDARSTVLERLAHLRRRIAEHVDYKNRDLDSESSDDEPAPSDGKPVVPDPPVSAPPVTDFKLLDAQPTRAEYWIGLSTVAPAPTAVVGETHAPGPQPLDQMKEHLCERGFFIGATLASAEVMHAIHRRTQDVVAAGWPPAFVFMYNEPWQVVKAMWPTAAALLGGEVVLEPSFAAFLLNHRKMVAGERYTCRSNVQRTLGMQHATYNVHLAVFLAEPSPDRHKTGRRQALTHGERTRCKTRQCVPEAPQIVIALRDTAMQHHGLQHSNRQRPPEPPQENRRPSERR
jgi:hypothetical protein